MYHFWERLEGKEASNSMVDFIKEIMAGGKSSDLSPAAPAPSLTPATSLWRCYQLKGDKWFEITKSFKKMNCNEFIHRPVVITGNGKVYCGNEAAWHKNEGRPRVWLYQWLLDRIPESDLDTFLRRPIAKYI